MTAPINHSICVLATGIGAIIGQGIIRGLRASGYRTKIIGLDRSTRPPGPEWCDAFVQKPHCEETSPKYLEFWHSLIREHKIDLVLPGLEVDVDFLDVHRKTLELATNCTIALNRHALIDLANDKWRMHLHLEAHDFPSIPTVIPTTWEDAMEKLGKPPILMKPCRSNGGRGIVRLHDRNDFDYWIRKAEGPCMLQRIVGSDDEEFTVGSFGLGGGDALDPIIFRRRLCAAGNTVMAEVVTNKLISERVAALNALLQPEGPTNYQFRIEHGEAYLLECNPRFSSSNSLRTKFGYNEAAMSINHFHYRRQPQPPIILGGTGWRYSEDYVTHDRDPV